MNRHMFLTCIFLLLLVSLASVPAAAAIVSCPSSCTCLLPAEAEKINTPGLCSGRQIRCADDGKNEKYCYEKTSTTKTVPQIIVTGYHIITTTPTPVVPVKCQPGCTCLLDPAGRGSLGYCGGKPALCGYGADNTPMYCFTLPAEPGVSAGITASVTLLPIKNVQATTPAPAVPPSGVPAATLPCSAGCSCLAADKADAANYKRCSGSSDPCDYDPLGRAIFCYQTGKVDATALVPEGISLEPVPKATPKTSVSLQKKGEKYSRLDIVIAKLSGSSLPQSSTPSQRVLCNGSFSDIMSDPANCGSCGAFCSKGLECRMGECRQNGTETMRWPCSAFQIQCNGTCISYLHDDGNCGTCGNRCAAGESCCSGHCTNTNTDLQNCHACGAVCGESATCTQGVCTCIYDTTRCGTGCVDLMTSEGHCGECNVRCGTGESCCEGHCIDVTRNAMNCGTCGHTCETYFYCRDSRCIDPETNEEHCGDSNRRCGEDMFCCNGVCVDTGSNPGHCGSCGTRCYSDQSCINGECLNLLTDADNCGSAGNHCWLDDGGDCCNGLCVDFGFDDHNCGSCGHDCPWYYPFCMYGDCWDLGSMTIWAFFVSPY